MKKIIFIKNAIILTVSSLVLRFAGIIFKVWLAALIGSEGIGLYQLIFSVYMLAATFASSGICTAVTRMVADELALGTKKGALKILRRSVQFTLFVALASLCIMFFGAEFISLKFLGDIRAVPALKILGFSLPFMGISSCLKGYFIARRKAGPGSFAQLFEQGVRIALIIFLVKKLAGKGLAYSCGAVLLGDTIAEGLSCLVLWLIYLNDTKFKDSPPQKESMPKGILRKILHISVPITAGRYLNTALRTGENILVPKTLAQSPTGGDRALSQFGMIKGMALPVLFFPSTLLNALSTLLIPEISEASARGRKNLVRSAAENILRLTAMISFIFAAIFFVAGGQIGELVYKSPDVGALLIALSPIVPLMYLDSVSDGILKGLDQQVFTFRTAIFDSSVRILLILIILPRFGLTGFIGIMYFSNLLTCGCNVGRLIKISGARLNIMREIILPASAALAITLLANTVLSFLGALNLFIYVFLLCLISIPVYILLLFIFGSVALDDIKSFIR